MADIIKKQGIQGEVAEAGVWKGGFASVINRMFPDRKLYLYDTFTGFQQSDIEIDVSSGFTPAGYFELGQGVNGFQMKTREQLIDIVMEKMKYPENIILRPGNFPDSAKADENVCFSFVSLDMDLYRPMRDGLDFFWKKLAPGGYIFIHDYNYIGHFGVHKAVEEFEAANGCVPKFPVTDSCGTLVLNKPYE